jgi:hypothetical protein
MMDCQPSGESTISPLELSKTLARLGLGQYEDRLRENGFTSWENMISITETDMAKLNIKLGHRRQLQGAISEYSSPSTYHVEYEPTSLTVPSEKIPAIGEHSDAMQRSSQQMAFTTKPYRQHQQPDLSTLHKPKTAYVLFSEHVRQDPALSGLTFIEIAKEVERRWKELSGEKRLKDWETPAADRLKEYKEELKCYEQTTSYQSYRTYLEGSEQGARNPESIISVEDEASPASTPASSNLLPASHSQERLGATLARSFNSEDSNVEHWLQGPSSPVRSGMEEVRHVMRTLDIDTHLIGVTTFPPEYMTRKAVEAFLYGTGSLLYLWNQDEALNLVKSIYRPQSGSKPADAIEVFAMSAVGSLCDGQNYTVPLQERFLHIFLSMMSSTSDVSSLRCMRLYACLAVCLFTNIVKSARKLMCKRPMFLISGNELTDQSVCPQYWKVLACISSIYNRKLRRRITLLVECISKHHLPRKVRMLQYFEAVLGLLRYF